MHHDLSSVNHRSILVVETNRRDDEETEDPLPEKVAFNRPTCLHHTRLPSPPPLQRTSHIYMPSYLFSLFFALRRKLLYCLLLREDRLLTNPPWKRQRHLRTTPVSTQQFQRGMCLLESRHTQGLLQALVCMRTCMLLLLSE